MVFKMLQKKYDCVALDIYGFFEAIERIVEKLYKDQMHDEEGNSLFGENLTEFLDISLEWFENFVSE